MKNVFSVLFIALCLLGFNNSATAQMMFGAKAGLNLANVAFSEDGFDTDMLPTFQIGGIVEFNISDKIAIQPGLSFFGRGAKQTVEFLGQKFESKSSPYYINVPINVVYKANKFFVGAGPYVSLGIAGSTSSGDNSEKIKWGSAVTDGASALDFGLNVEAGVIFNRIRVGAGYGLGLANIIPKDARTGDEKATNRVISIFAAYMFSDDEGRD